MAEAAAHPNTDLSSEGDAGAAAQLNADAAAGPHNGDTDSDVELGSSSQQASVCGLIVGVTAAAASGQHTTNGSPGATQATACGSHKHLRCPRTPHQPPLCFASLPPLFPPSLLPKKHQQTPKPQQVRDQLEEVSSRHKHRGDAAFQRQEVRGVGGERESECACVGVEAAGSVGGCHHCGGLASVAWGVYSPQ